MNNSSNDLETQIIAKLQNPDRQQRIEALNYILENRSDTLVEQILEVLKESEWETKKQVLDDITGMKDQAFSLLKALIETCHDDNVSILLIEILGKIKNQESLDLLLEIYDHGSLQLQKAAVKSLAYSEDPRILKRLINDFSCKPWSVCQTIFSSLFNLGTRISSLLMEHLSSRDHNVLYWIIKLLGGLKVREAVDPLIQLLENPHNEDIFLFIFRALGSIGGEKANQCLVDHFNTCKDWFIRKEIVHSLGKFSSDLSLKTLVKALSDEEWSVSREAALGLARLGDRSLKYLLEHIEQENQSANYFVLKVLGDIGSKEAVPPLLKLLDRLNTEELEKRKWLIVETLGKIGDPACLPHIEPLLSSGHWFLRRCVAEAMGKIGNASSLPLLETALENDDNWHVKRAAQTAIRQIKARAHPHL